MCHLNIFTPTILYETTRAKKKKRSEAGEKGEKAKSVYSRKEMNIYFSRILKLGKCMLGRI